MVIDFDNICLDNLRHTVGIFNPLPETILTLVIKNFNASNLLSMQDMFNSNKYLKYIDIGYINTDNISSTSRMFIDCVRLEGINFEASSTERLIDTSEMFNKCNALKNVDIPKIIPNSSSLITLDFMFTDCKNLKNLDLSTLNLNSYAMTYKMFSGCGGLISNTESIKFPSNSHSAEILVAQVLEDEWE